MWEDYFSVQIFFIILRETLESAIIISVLLSLVKQAFTKVNPVTKISELAVPKQLYDSYCLQIWFGALGGLALCLGIGGVFIGIFYFVGNDVWSLAERVWEGFFSILSAIIIALMGVALLRVNTMQSKWRWKLSKSLQSTNLNASNIDSPDVEDSPETAAVSQESIDENTPMTAPDPNLEDLSQKKSSFRGKMHHLAEKYSLVILPFITTLREGLEAVVFVGGIGVNQPATSFPLAVLAGALVGIGVGVAMYKGGNKMSLQVFLIASSCFLYLVAAGLMSKGVWFFELESFVEKCGQDTSETGSGPGSYDVSNTLWHVNCCNGLTDGGWMLLNALFGWSNTATYGSVSSYVIFWMAIILLLKAKSAVEDKGYNSAMPISWQLKRIEKRIMADKLLIREYELTQNDENGMELATQPPSTRGSKQTSPEHQQNEENSLLQ